jgi:putative acetyltransferase
MDVRAARLQDRDDVQRLYACAFPEGERDLVAKLAIDLLAENTRPRTISLVAQTKGVVIGHIAFSPVKIAHNAMLQGYILAPLAVKPSEQKRRIGSGLIEYGMQQLSAMGVNVVFVYGDPDYYGRFGFSADAAHQYRAPYRLQYPFGWQASVLNACKLEKPPVAITCVDSLNDPQLW